MSWINHPAYARARDRLIERFRDRALEFQHLRPVIFLCGGRDSSRRKFLADYITRHHSDHLVFFAEHVWKHVQELESINALDMEAQLARLADLVLLIVESPGTFAELGAFATSPDLRRKLWPVLDAKYAADEESFIRTGPIRWVDADSRFKPALYCDFDTLIEAVRELKNRLERIPQRGPLPLQDRADPHERPKHLLLLLADLLSVIGPASHEDCEYYLEQILGMPPIWSIASLLGLGAALNLFRPRTVGDTVYFIRPLDGGRLVAQQREHMFNLAQERARLLAIIQRIPSAKRVLTEVATNAA